MFIYVYISCPLKDMNCYKNFGYCNDDYILLIDVKNLPVLLL